MDESNTYHDVTPTWFRIDPRMRVSGVTVDDQRTAVSEAALQGYCVGYMEAMGSWLRKQVGTEIAGEYCARFDECAGVLRGALGIEMGGSE